MCPVALSKHVWTKSGCMTCLETVPPGGVRTVQDCPLKASIVR